jgi:hypothetical protein
MEHSQYSICHFVVPRETIISYLVTNRLRRATSLSGCLLRNIQCCRQRNYFVNHATHEDINGDFQSQHALVLVSLAGAAMVYS